MCVCVCVCAHVRWGGVREDTIQFPLPIPNHIVRTLHVIAFCRRSTKNRRKAERKKHSLREGSANEDLALMEALGEIVSTVDRLQDEVASLLGILVQLGFTSQGKDIQRTFEKLLGLVKSKMSEIWPPQGQDQSLSNISVASIGVSNYGIDYADID